MLRAHVRSQYGFVHVNMSDVFDLTVSELGLKPRDILNTAYPEDAGSNDHCLARGRAVAPAPGAAVLDRQQIGGEKPASGQAVPLSERRG